MVFDVRVVLPDELDFYSFSLTPCTSAKLLMRGSGRSSQFGSSWYQFVNGCRQDRDRAETRGRKSMRAAGVEHEYAIVSLSSELHVTEGIW
jgi:hypothetical protein